MIVVGLAGFVLQTGWSSELTILVTEPSGLLASIDLATVPLFIMMGTFVTMAGFSNDIYAAAAALLGRRRGALAYATIGGSAIFGAVCGSSTATAATFAKIALPEMLRRGYAPAFASGAIAAGGTLKSLIPPSLVMILYCVVAKTFIFDLFVAALIPAALTIALNLAAIALTAALDPSVAPLAEPLPWGERLKALARALPALALIAVLFGGLYSGVFTVNEAACVAAVLAFLCALARRRVSFAALAAELAQAASVTAMIYLMVIGATIFSYFIALARVPEALIAAIAALKLPPVAVIFILLATYLVLGAVFDEIAALLITVPLVLPLILKLGYDPVWWGVMNVVIVELGMIVPPIGIVVFLLHGLAPQIPVWTIYRGVTPFILADVAVLTILALYPQLALWLPHVLGSG
jgi:tripartite ATP-independent transporter DctM subunit